MNRSLAALVAACGLLLAGPALAGPGGSVLAHAELSASTPGLGELVETGPSELRLIFSEPFEPQYTSLDVIDDSGETIVNNEGAPDESDAYTLVSPLPELDDGIYRVAWTALSAADGHTTSGEFTFGVGDVDLGGVTIEEAGGALHEGHGAGLAILETESRALSYLGFLLAVGLPLIGWLVLRRSVSPRALAVAFGLAIVGSAGLLYVTAETAGIDVISYATTGRSGQLFALRVIVALVGLAVVGLLARMSRARPAAIASLAIGLVGLVVVAAVGHASAYVSPAPLIAIVFHLIAGGIWLSGVLVVAWLAFQREGPVPLSEAVPRFSALALVAIGIVGMTGIYSDWVQTRDLLAFDTPYGSALLIKIVLSIGALTLGAFNYFDGGRGLTRFGGLRKRVVLESLLAAGVVIATGNLTSGSPPAQSKAIEIAVAASTTQQLGGGTALALEPGRPGPTRFVATIDAPRPISEAVLELASMDVLEEPTAYPLRPLAGGPGRYIVDGTLLEPNSLWAATLVARDESGAEMGRTRFEFGMGQTGISAGRATPPLDPGLVVAILLVVGGLLLATFAVAGGGLPRTDIRTSRYASVAGSVAAISLGVVILVAGTL